MKKISSVLIGLLCHQFAIAQNQSPIIAIQQVSLDSTARHLSIDYILTDAENNNCDITFLASNDGGKTFTVNTQNATGDIGLGLTPMGNKQIYWKFGLAVNDLALLKIKIVANDNQPINIQDVVNEVDSMRLKRDLFQFEGRRNYSSSPARMAQIKDSLEARLSLGTNYIERVEFSFNGLKAENIIATKQGVINETDVYIVDAHFDGVAQSPSADDNGSGMVALMEISRILKKYNFNKSIKIIGFDLEELGLIGSSNYASSSAISGINLLGVYNFEMIGYYSNAVNTQRFPAGFSQLFPAAYNASVADSLRGNFITNVGNGNSGSFVSTFDSAAARYVPSLKVITLVVPGNGSIAPDLRRSDHASFWDINKSAVMLTDGADFRNSNYHTVQDSAKYLNYTFMANVTKAVVGALAEQAQINHSTVEISGVTSYFATSTPSLENSKLLSVFPNPVNQKLTIVWLGDAAQVEIHDVLGKKVKQLKLSPRSTAEVDVSELPAGLYTLRCYTSSKTFAQEIIIER